MKKFFRQLKGKRELRKLNYKYSLRLNKIDTMIEETKTSLDTLSPFCNEESTALLTKKVELLRGLMDTTRSEFVIYQNIIKTLYELD